MSPSLHGTLLSLATIVALLFAGIILARNPRSTPARMHSIYGGIAAWWLFCMAMVAASETHEQVHYWARFVQLSLAMLPAVIFHLNVATAGVAHRYQRRIRWHYAISAALTVFCLANPALFSTPLEYSWGFYPRYTLWGTLTLFFLAVTFLEVILVYRKALATAAEGTAYREKVRAFYHGNMFASVALIDFAASFGYGVYPFGYVVMTLMHIATVVGAIRYRLIQLTPEFTAAPILHSIPDGVVVVDTQGLVRLINESGASMFGYDREDLSNKPVGEVAPSAIADILRKPSKMTARELSFTNADAHTFTVRLSTSVLYDQKEEAVGHAWVMHDLTEQRQVEAEKNELEGWVRSGQKLETLGVMAGGIAHDFNNILAAILGSAELAKDRAEGDVNEELDIIIGAAERANELTAQLLTLAGQNTRNERPVDINTICKEMSELARTAVSRKASFTTEFTEKLPLVVGDSGELTQVILNLIANASEALDDQVGTVSLRTDVVDMQAEGSQTLVPHVIIEVADSGYGMDQKTMDRIFDPFFTTKFTGRGLGLANVMGIVESHNGRIKVDSQVGKGSTFTIALPATRSRSVEVSQQESRSDWHGTGVVLLVDDEAAVRNVAAKMLQRIGFDTLEASNGKEAIAVLATPNVVISVVLLDITMPEMDGLETLNIIRSIPNNIPILLTSGYQESDVVQSPIDENTSYLKKPFHFNQLTNEVKRLTTGTDIPNPASP